VSFSFSLDFAYAKSISFSLSYAARQHPGRKSRWQRTLLKFFFPYIVLLLGDRKLVEGG
jgi:hypothetical protein